MAARFARALGSQLRLRAPSALTRGMASVDGPLKRTALYEAHLKLSGKMVPFAGYELPVQYPDGVVTNHIWVRESAGLFDVSHMGQLRFYGKDAVSFLESVVVADIQALKPHAATLSVITNERGGIIDDCIVTKEDGFIGMVVNGACKEKDMAHFKKHMQQQGKDVRMEYLEDRALLALQGPKAAAVLAKEIASSVDLNKWPFMHGDNLKVGGLDCYVTRCGYTGEDGFEISVKNSQAVQLMDLLLKHSEVKPAGLGVRDSLRLEAGLCLYGHDLNEDINPVEAGLLWTISKRRREQGGFLGAKPIQDAIKQGPAKKRVGLLVSGAPAREEAPIQDAAGNRVGTVTSGTFSPILKKPVAMGYVQAAHAANGTKLQVVTRGKAAGAEVTKMPFVPTKYFKAA